MNVNEVRVIGRLGQDPELRYTQTGTAVCNFSVAVSEYRQKKDGSGGWDEFTTWIDMTAWDRNADKIAGQAKKGTEVCVKGRVQTNRWEDEGGKVNIKQYVLVDHFQAGEGRIKNEESNGQSVGTSPDENPKPEIPDKPKPEDGQPPTDDDGDDLPF